MSTRDGQGQMLTISLTEGRTAVRRSLFAVRQSKAKIPVPRVSRCSLFALRQSKAEIPVPQVRPSFGLTWDYGYRCRAQAEIHEPRLASKPGTRTWGTVRHVGYGIRGAASAEPGGRAALQRRVPARPFLSCHHERASAREGPAVPNHRAMVERKRMPRSARHDKWEP